MNDHLARWVKDFGFFVIVSMEEPNPILAYFVFRCEQEVDWMCVSLEDPFFRYLCSTCEGIGLEDKQMYEH